MGPEGLGGAELGRRLGMHNMHKNSPLTKVITSPRRCHICMTFSLSSVVRVTRATAIAATVRRVASEKIECRCSLSRLGKDKNAKRMSSILMGVVIIIK